MSEYVAQGLVSFVVKSQMIRIVSSVLVVSVTAIEFQGVGENSQRQWVGRWVWLCCTEIILIKFGLGCSLLIPDLVYKIRSDYIGWYWRDRRRLSLLKDVLYFVRSL